MVWVGQSGERSLKRIETAGGRASGGIKDVDRHAELLHTGMPLHGSAFAIPKAQHRALDEQRVGAFMAQQGDLGLDAARGRKTTQPR